MKLYETTPRYDEKYTHQTKFSSVSDEEFEENTIPWKATIKDRLIQFVFFIIFFGWLRFICLLLVTLIYVIIMSPVLVFYNHPDIIKLMKTPGIFATRVYFRFLFFFLGVFYIKKTGSVDPRTRCIIFNHHTLIDGLLIYMYQPFLVIGIEKLGRDPIVGRILKAAGSIFIDRSKHEGISHVITEYLSKKREMPLAIAPEGRTEKGLFMLQFRTGAFIADAPIQPVTLQFKNFLPYGRTGIIWTYAQPFEWLIRLLSMPGCMVQVDFLPVIEGEEFYAKSPMEKALYCNLVMANHLGNKASDRSTRYYYKNNDKKKEQLKDQKKEEIPHENKKELSP